LHRREQGGIMMSELVCVPSVSTGGEDFRRHGQTGTGENEHAAVGTDTQFGVVAGRCDWMRRATQCDVDRIDGLLGLIFRNKINSAAIVRPKRFLHAAVEAFGEIRDLMRRAIVKHQAPAIAFITGPKSCVISNRMSVGRIDRMTVETRIRRDSPRIATAKSDREKIAVGAGGLGPVGNCSEANFLGIGRKGDIRRIVSLVGRHIVIRTRSEVAWCYSGGGNYESM